MIFACKWVWTKCDIDKHSWLSPQQLVLIFPLALPPLQSSPLSNLDWTSPPRSTTPVPFFPPTLSYEGPNWLLLLLLLFIFKKKKSYKFYVIRRGICFVSWLYVDYQFGFSQLLFLSICSYFFFHSLIVCFVFWLNLVWGANDIWVRYNASWNLSSSWDIMYHIWVLCVKFYLFIIFFLWKFYV